MTLRQFALLPVAVCFALAGCAGHPLWNNPGTIQQQRLRATVHDPYPDQDLGPATDGGRPRDYLQPLPEPVRNRIIADTWFGR
jgi:hypothetical protein